MDPILINLKILLPFGIFLENSNVTRIHVETINGLNGILPNRLDCAASLVPGILMYETPEGINYIAVDEGILVKTGNNVMISARNAAGGADIGQLYDTIENEFLKLDEKEKSARTTIARLESGLIRQYEKFRK